MKRRIAILFLGIYLLSFSELSQFLKLPVLVQHFIEHRQLDSSTTFWAFIKEHYNGKFEIDEDYHRDSELPFRTCHCVGVNNVVIADTPSMCELDHHPYTLLRVFILHNEVERHVQTIHDIWQPPRPLPA